MAGPASPQGAALDQYLRTQYEVIRVVHDNMDAIRAVASHLTPVEDLQDFQDQVEALYAELGMLVEASGLLTSASSAGLALLDAADAAAQRLLLELGDIATHSAAEFAHAIDVVTVQGLVTELQTQLADLALTKADASQVASLSDQVNLLVTSDSTQAAQLIEIAATLDDQASQLAAQATVQVDTTAAVNQQGDNIEALTTQLNTLQAHVDDPEAGLDVLATAQQTLSARTSTLEGQVASQADAITALGVTANDALTQSEAAASAVDTLTTQVTNIGNAQTSTANDVAALTARVDDHDLSLTAEADARLDLTARVTANEGSLEILSSSITDLNSGLIGGDNLLWNSDFSLASSRSSGVGAYKQPKYWVQAGTALTPLGYPITSVKLPGTIYGYHVSSGAGGGVLTDQYLDLSMSTVDGDKYPAAVPNQQYVFSVDVRGANVSTELRMYIQFLDAANAVLRTDTSPAYTNLSTTDFQRYTFKAPLLSPANTAKVRIYAVRLFNRATAANFDFWFEATRAQFQEGAAATAWSPSLNYQVDASTQLETRITTNENNITTVMASYTMTLDVNGYVTGWKFTNDGTTGVMDMRADLFRITPPSGFKSIALANGIISSESVSYARYMGVDFGPGNAYIDWYGVKPGSGAAGVTDAAAKFYIKANGDAFFAGVLTSDNVGAWLGGRGINLLPDNYSTFEYVPLAVSPAATATATVDTTVSIMGGASLKVVATGADAAVYLGKTTADFNIRTTAGKSYIVSGYVRCNQASKPGQMMLREGDGATFTSFDFVTPATANTTVRVSGVLTPPVGATSMLLRVDNDGGAGCTMWFDGLMVEERVGGQTIPSAYSRGSTAVNVIAVKAVADGAQSAATTAQTTATTAQTTANTAQTTANTAQFTADNKVASVGDNLIANPTFTLNSIDAVNGAILTPGSWGCDGWNASWIGYSTTNGSEPGMVAKWVNTGSLLVYVNAPVNVPNGVSCLSRFTSLAFPVKPSTSYLASFSDTQAFNGSLPAGVTAQTRMVIDWQDGTGAHISYSILARSRAAAAPPETEFVSPATAKSCQIWYDVAVVNASGGLWSHNSTVALSGTCNWIQLTKKMETTAQLPMIMYGNGRAKVLTNITYSASAGPPSTATVNVAAFNLISGARTISYNAMSVSLSHAAGTVQYYLYVDDPSATGGAKTLVATTVGDDVYASEGRLYIGDVAVTFPSSGTSSGSGGRTDSCVCVDMFLEQDFLALEARVGDSIDCIDIPNSLDPLQRLIERVCFADAEAVRLVTDQGAKLDLSASTPFDLLDGRTCEARHMQGEWVVTNCRGELQVEQVVRVLELGWQPVARISVGGISYAAGHDPDHRIYSHNSIKP